MPTYRSAAGQVLTVDTEMIDVTTNLPRPDRDWRFTDVNGHEHYWSENGWPTLKEVVDDSYWCDDCEEEHEQSHWECAACGVPVPPGMRPPSGFREYAPGLRRYLIDGEEVSEAEAQEFVRNAEQA